MSEQAKRFRRRWLMRVAHTRTQLTYTIALAACVRAHRIHKLFRLVYWGAPLSSVALLERTNEPAIHRPSERLKKNVLLRMWKYSKCMCVCVWVILTLGTTRINWKKSTVCVNATSSPLTQAVWMRQLTPLSIVPVPRVRIELYYTPGIITIIDIQPATRYIPFNEKLSIGTRATICYAQRRWQQKQQQYSGNQ